MSFGEESNYREDQILESGGFQDQRAADGEGI